MALVDRLVTRYEMDNRDYVQGARQVNSATDSNTKSMGGFTAMLGTAAAAINPVTIAVTALTVGFTALIAGATAGALGLAQLMRAASSASSEVEGLRMGLMAYAGSAEEADRQLKRLQIVARAPGLGFAESIQGSVQLQAAGFDSRLAERSLMGFGNALALVGRGRAELDGVILALGQIAAKGKVSAEEINQIAERVPQIRQIIKEQFGTAVTEDLARMGVSAEQFIVKVVRGLENLPKAGQTFANSIENLKDTGFVALAQIGEGINKSLVPVLTTVSDFVEYINESGMLRAVGEGFGQLFRLDDKEGFVNFLATIVAVFENIPALVRVIADEMKSFVTGAVQFVNSIVDSINSFATEGVGKFMGFKEIAKVAVPTFAMADSFNQIYSDTIKPRAAEIAAGFADFKPENSLDGGEGGFREGQMNAEAQTKLLEKIEMHTKTMAELSVGTIGGSIRGSERFNAVRINSFNQSVGDPWAQAVGAIRVAALSEIGAQVRYSG